jgi:hypothetical protein
VVIAFLKRLLRPAQAPTPPIPPQQLKRKQSRRALKRKAMRGTIRLDPDHPFIRGR